MGQVLITSPTTRPSTVCVQRHPPPPARGAQVISIQPLLGYLRAVVLGCRASRNAALGHRASLARIAPRLFASYLGGVLDEPIIAPSAFKHGLSREDILHA